MNLKRLVALVLAAVLGVSALTGCGTKTDVNEPIATMGEQTVTFGLANFLCKYQKSTADDLYAAYFGDKAWDVDMYGYGTTLEDDLKASAMSALHQLYTLKAHMADYNVTITAEEEKAIKDAAVAFMAANSAEAIEEFGATEEIVIEMLTLYTIQVKMYDAISAKIDTVVSDEEANMRGYSLVTISLTGKYDEKNTFVKYTEDELKAVKDDALKMGVDLKTGTLEDVAKSHNYTVTKGAYATYEDEKTLDAKLLEAMGKLKEGEVSEAIETSTAIYFVRIDADTDKEKTEAHRKEILEERKADLYSKEVTAWQKDDGWKVDEAVLAKIDFHHMFTHGTEKDTQSTENTQSTEDTQSTETTQGTEGTTAGE